MDERCFRDPFTFDFMEEKKEKDLSFLQAQNIWLRHRDTTKMFLMMFLSNHAPAGPLLHSNNITHWEVDA